MPSLWAMWWPEIVKAVLLAVIAYFIRMISRKIDNLATKDFVFDTVKDSAATTEKKIESRHHENDTRIGRVENDMAQVRSDIDWIKRLFKKEL